MEKLEWHFVEELGSLEPMTLAKTCGVVLSVSIETTFLSFTISDSTNSLEVTLYEDERVYGMMKLPVKGNHVIVLGQVFKKELGSDSQDFMIKMKLKTFKIVTMESWFQIFKETLDRLALEQEEEAGETSAVTRKKIPLIKELRSVVVPIDIRTLILCAVYMTLQNNPDLSSYTFSAATVQKHRLTKSFLQAKKLKEQCIDYLEEYIQKGLQQLQGQHLIIHKNESESGTQKIYKINRSTFIDLEVRILGLINERKEMQGITSVQIVHYLNRELGCTEERNYAFSEILIHKMLKKLIEDRRIFKTSDKILYPHT